MRLAPYPRDYVFVRSFSVKDGCPFVQPALFLRPNLFFLGLASSIVLLALDNRPRC